MRLTAVFMLFFSLHVSATVVSQITFEAKNMPLKEVLDSIQQRTMYTFLYAGKTLDNTKPVTINVKDVSLELFIRDCLKDQLLGYKIDGESVFIFPLNKEKEVPHFDMSDIPPPIEVKGRVVNEKGEPVAGATVGIKGSKKATSTNADGVFSISVNEGDILIVSSIGFNQKEIKVNGNNVGEIGLSIANAELQEVVVNKGYYTEKKILNTGNVATVSAKEIGQQPVSNPLAALAGRVPGLVVSQNTGAPGSGFKVKVRGQNSMSNGNDPLYIVDGVPYPSQMPNNNSLNGNLGGGSPLNFINVADIENIDVLKDADATAIYGSRGASGVILITTKKGKSGLPKIDLNAYTGVGKITKFMKLMNTEQYLEMRKEAFKNDDVVIPTVPTAGMYDITFWDQTRYTDWQKLLIGNTANYNDAQLTLSGGTNNTQYLIGGGLHKERNVFATSGADRKVSTHFNLTTSGLNNKLKINFTASFVGDRNNVAPSGFGLAAFTLPPNAPEVYKNGTLNWEPIAPGAIGTWANPLASTRQTYLGKTNRLTGSAVLSYVITPDLEIKTNIGYNNSRTDEVTTNPTTAIDPGRKPITGSASYLNSSNTAWIIEPQVNYNISLVSGRLSALAGTTFQETVTNYSAASASGFTNNIFLTNPQAATTYTPRGFFINQYKYSALFGRLNYTLKEKYIINLTARRDGSSRFGPENQWANFGAVGLGWIFSKESFINKSLPWLSFGKLRFSYGSTGNDQIPDYRFMDLYTNSSTAYLDSKGLSANNLFNAYLQWELTKKLEIGTELGLLNDHLNVSISYFRNRSGNQLLSAPLSLFTGFANITTNLNAVVENRGWEFLLNTNNVKSKNFSWSSSFNLTIPKNELIAFENQENSYYKNVYFIGQPISIINVFSSAGINPNTGVLEYRNKKGEAITADLLASEDQNKLINLLPVLYGGLQNNLRYKRVELALFFQYVKQTGRSVYNTIPPGFPNNQNVEALDRWQKPGDIARYQKYTQSYISDAYNATFILPQSDLSYGDASFVRLKTLSLSWNLPSTLLTRLHISNLRVYGQGQNLLTFTNFMGYDPETQGTSLPPIKVFTFGIQASF
jgi:TonB-dependent starch-binding outer membrane protein SusC